MWRIRDRIGVSKRGKVLLLLTSDLLIRPWELASSFCSLRNLLKDCYKGFIEYKILEPLQWNLIVIFLNGLADSLDIELLEL